MRNKKILFGICAAVLTMLSITGCSDTSSKEENSTQIVKVTQVDGNTITAQTGTLKESTDGMPENQKPDGTPPAKPGDSDNSENQKDENANPPQGEPPQNDSSQGQPPQGDAPQNDSSQGQPPQGGAPQNDSSQGQPPQGAPGGKTFEESGETITFSLSDTTNIVLEQLQGEAEGSAKDIVKDAVLEITLDKNNTATKIIVRNLQAGNGFGGSDTVSNGTAVTTIDTDTDKSGETYESSGDDENALRIDGATVTLNESTIRKNGGASSNTENGDFYGANAGLLALNKATVTISGAEVNTDAVNGNGIFSYGEGTTVNVSDSKIRTTQNNSGGIQTTGGATMNASNLDIETSGNSSAAIRSDRGGGTVTVDSGTYVTNGTGSPAVYSTADITVKNSTLKANASEGIVVEGKNSVTLENCDVTGNMTGTYQGDASENIHGIMIYQSMSGDADMGEAAFSAKDGSITTKSGDLFYITNTDCKIDLENVTLYPANDTLLRVEGNSSSRGWGTQGANGGNVTLTAKKQTLKGNMIVDKISSLDMTLSETSRFEGSINSDGDAGTVKVSLEDHATWSLTADSYISEFQGDAAQIEANGHHLYVNGEQIL